MPAALRRIYALFLRQIYLVRRSPPRWIAYMFWPTMQMVIWGYLNKYLHMESGLATMAFTTLLGANLIANFFERTNVQIMWGFLEDVWAKNIGNILITPITSMEMVSGYILNGLIAVIIGLSAATLVSYVMFDYSIFSVGIYLIPMILNLIISGWAVGLILISLLFRYGASGEHFGWMIAFIFVPFAAVYYPVTVLPQWAQYISFILPPTHVFEALRHLIKTGLFDWNQFYLALGLNVVWIAGGFYIFISQLNKARQRGGLFTMAE